MGLEEFAAEWLARLDPLSRMTIGSSSGSAESERAAGSPAASRASSTMNAAVDVRAILPNIHVPTLVLVRETAATPKGGVDVDAVAEAGWVAERIPNASLVLVAGRDYLPWIGDQDALVDEIASFVTGARPARQPDRVLSTILFTDLVGSTEREVSSGTTVGGASRGARRGRPDHCSSASAGARSITRATAFGAFDGPARAVRCGLAIVSELEHLELDVRVGIHTGEVEVVGAEISGIAVHIGARVAALGAAGDVLATPEP